MGSLTERKKSALWRMYECDLYVWAQTNAQLLREGRLSEIDVEHIAEELEDVGKSERRALASHIRNLVMHLLKWQFQSRLRSVSWELSIRNARREIQLILEDSPSLVQRFPDLLAREYSVARTNAIVETGLQEATFPEHCFYTPEQVQDQHFWPDPQA